MLFWLAGLSELPSAVPVALRETGASRKKLEAFLDDKGERAQTLRSSGLGPSDVGYPGESEIEPFALTLALVVAGMTNRPALLQYSVHPVIRRKLTAFEHAPRRVAMFAR